MKKTLLITAAVISALSASATPVLVSSETSLQTIINNKVVGTAINVNSNQVADDAYWTAAQDVSAYLIIELAGYAPNNAFGIYEISSPANKVQIFAGSATGLSGQVGVAVPNSWASFGFYMKNLTQGFTWYSDSSLNAGGGLDHFVAYQGASGATFAGATFDSNDYVFGIEDLNLGDKDYNDMVVLVQNINRVPESSQTIALLGLGLCSLHLLRRRQLATGK